MKPVRGMSKRFRLAGAAAALALVVAACGGGGDTDPAPAAPSPSDPATTPEEAPTGGTLRVAMGSLPPILDPVQYNTPPNNFVQELLFATVTKVNSLGADVIIEPYVAESWKSVSELEWEIALVPGLQFSNGEPLDAEAVKFSAEYVLDPANNKAMRSRINTIDTVEVIDANTLKITTLFADPLLPSRLGALAVLPPVDFQARGEAEFVTDPVGAGPFLVEEFVRDERLVLVPNPNSARFTPSLDRLIFQVIPEAGSRIAALRAGDVDMVHRLPTEQIDRVRADGFVVEGFVESGTYNMSMIMEDGPLADPAVRRALQYAIDRETLNDRILAGLGEPASQLVNPGFTGFCERIEVFPYDPDLARRLLAEAGYPNGFDLQMQASRGFLLNDDTLAEAVQGYLGDVGVNVELDIMEFSLYLDAFFNRDQRTGLFLWRVSGNPFLDADLSMSFWLSTDPVHNAPYANEEYDALFQQSRRELDPAARQELLCQASEVLLEDSPVMPILYLPDVWGMTDSVFGFQAEAYGVPSFVTMSVRN